MAHGTVWVDALQQSVAGRKRHLEPGTAATIYDEWDNDFGECEHVGGKFLLPVAEAVIAK